MTELGNGNIQIAAGVDSSSYRDSGFRFSKSYIDYMKVIAKNETVNVEQLTEKKQSYVNGEEEDLQGRPVGRKTLAGAIKAVDSGEADYFIGNYYSVDYYLKALGSENVSIVPMSEEGSMSFAFAREADTRLISVWNKCLYGIGRSQIQIMLMDGLYPPAKNITVAQVIRANPLITAGIILFILLIILLTWYIVLRQKWISARKHAVDVKRYEVLAALMDEYVFEYDDNTQILHLDDKASEQFHIPNDVNMAEYDGKNPLLNALMKQYMEQMENRESESKPILIELENGKEEWYRMVMHPLENKAEKKPHVIGKLVSAQKEVEEQQRLLDHAQKDPLTGLYNRKRFAKKYKQIEVKDSIAYAVLDIDNFKSLNDTLGHAGGDEALKCLADKIRNIFKGKVIYSRFGGDEFTICTYDMPREKVEKLFERLVQEMNFDIEYQGMKKSLSISLGAVYRQKKLPLDTLLKDADEVLYKVKENGKNHWIME